MAIFANANTLITLKRATSYILEATTPAASMSPTRQPANASRVLLHASGSPSGSVTISGTVSGSADTEVLSWTGTAGARVSVKTFSAVSGLTSTLSGGTSIYGQAVGAGGQPDANKLSDIVVGYPVVLYQKNQPGWRGAAAGHEVEADAVVKFPYAEAFTPRVGDLLTTDTSETYEVISVHARSGGLRPSGWSLAVKRREGRT